MSTSKIQWTFEMLDKVSGPAQSAASSTLDMVRALHSSLAVMDYTIRGVKALGGAILAGIEPAVRQEKALGAFTTMLGDSAKAVDVYAEAVRFANETPFETKDIVDSYKQLLAAQFKADDLQIVTRIVGDASSLQDLPAEAMKSVNRALGQIKSKGKLSQEELNQVAEAVPLNQSMFLENLSKIYGTTLEQTRKLKDAGKISGEAGVYAILQTLSQQFGGNMERASMQLEGLWSTIESMPGTYLERLYDTKGYDAIRKALLGVTLALDPASEKGQKFGLLIDMLGGGVLERVGVLLEYLTAGASAFVDGLLAGLGPLDGTFGPTNQTNLEKFKILMEGIGTGVAKLSKAFGWLIDKLSQAWDYFYKIGEWWAKNESLSGFLDEYVSPMFNEKQTGGKLKNTTPELLQGSKQRKNTENVEFSMDMPMMADGGIVTRPTIALIGEAGPEQVIPLKDGSGSGGEIYAPINVSIQYTAEGSGKDPHEEDVSAIKLERRINAVLMTALDRWALQMGRRVYS